MIQFIKYTGEYPILCSGDLYLTIDGEEVVLSNVLSSGGKCYFTGDWEEHVESGPWRIDLEDYPQYQQYGAEILKLVNENVPFGCCGGCL